MAKEETEEEDEWNPFTPSLILMSNLHFASKNEFIMYSAKPLKVF